MMKVEAEGQAQKTIPYGAASRTLQARPVTYICARCGQVETTERYPGPTPRYCGECKTIRDVEDADADRRAARERMRRLRQRRKREDEERDARLPALF
jgi:hypothetical protein